MRALVLSAGGMFGAYQAGVWRALEDLGTPDIVVGASIGSVNAWLIASGCPAAEMTRRWLNLTHAGFVRWRLPRSVSDSLLDHWNLEREFREIAAHWQPRAQLGIVASDLKTLKPRLMRGPELDWAHLAASCAIPLVLPARRIEGRWLSDGGLVDPLPLWAAIEMGATRIVAVNLLKHRPWWLAAGARTLRWYAGYRESARGEGIQVVEIAPEQRLGTARQSIEWSRPLAERWLEMGEADALRRKHLVIECFRRNQTWPSTASTV